MGESIRYVVGWNWMISGRENYREIDHRFPKEADRYFDLIEAMGFTYNVRLTKRTSSEEIVREAKIEEEED